MAARQPAWTPPPREERPDIFYTVDPGLQASGYALWRFGVLIEVGLIRCPAKMKGVVARVQHQTALFFEHHQDLVPVVSERMVHIPRRGRALRTKGYVDPNDLINLTVLSGKLGTHWYLASEWKGNISRDVEQSRSRCALTPPELELVEAVLPESLRKEAWSAVGIGLSILGRAHSCIGWGRWS